MPDVMFPSIVNRQPSTVNRQPSTGHIDGTKIELSLLNVTPVENMN